MRELIKMIQEEIDWCKDPDYLGNLSGSYKKGFIAGLKQSILLIKKADESIKE